MKLRNKYIQHIICALTLLIALPSCHKDEPEPPVAECRRTVLVYQVANNNLGTSGYNEMDIKEMRKGASQGAIPADGRLLVYNAAPGVDPLLLEIKQYGIDTLKVYDQSVYSVSSIRMNEVFDDVATFAPSRETGLVLWSHGSGWLQDGMADEADNLIATLSFGSEKGHTMNISTLANILRKRPKLSFLYFDCCYMASVETLYELRDVAPVIVGSATELLVYGMPYDENISCFFSDESALVSAATNTFNLYNDMTGSSRTCTMSVVDTRGLDKLAEAAAKIFEKASPGLPTGFTPQRFMGSGVSTCYYFDFEHYVRALCFDSEDAARFGGAEQLFADFEAALNDCVIYRASTPMLWNDVELKHHCGLSTYIIDDESKLNKKNYNTLRWYTDVVSKLNFK